MINLKTAATTVTSLAVIVTAMISIETRYAKAADVNKLLRSQEQKVIWDLEENIEKSDTRQEQEKWLKRLRERVAEFCAEYPEEDECDRSYMEHIASYLLPSDQL